MTDTLIFCLCVSLACVAIHISIEHEDMIFSLLKPFLQNNFPEWLRKPIYECLMCMGGVWTVVFWVGEEKPISFQLLFAILITIGLNKLWCSLLELTEYGC